MRGPRRGSIVAAMTETLQAEPPAAPPPPPDARRLVRDPDDQVVAGVCAAFGRYTDTDPVLWRVTVAVLTLFGGAGLALYGLGWLLVPRLGQEQSVAERTLRRPDHGVSAAGVVLVVVAAVVLLALLDDGPGVGALLVIGGIAWLVARERRTSPTPPPPAVGTYETPAWAQEAPAPQPVAPRPPRERSALGPLTLSVAALVAGVLLAARLSGAEGITAEHVLAACLLVVGGGLVVGTWWGRARWLFAVGVLLALALAATAAVDGRLDDGVGERTWVARDGGEYRLGAGQAVLDLRSLSGGGRAEVSAEVGFGELVVLVPDGLSVAVTSDVGLGELRVEQEDGSQRTLGGDDDLHDEFVVGEGQDVSVELDLEVGVGAVEVRRVAA